MMDHAYVIRRLKDIGATAVHVRRGRIAVADVERIRNGTH